MALRVVALYWSFSSGIALAYNLHNPAAKGKQGLKPEEMSQNLLTNEKQGNLDKVNAANVIKLT
jgi:hypothetical protein